MDNYIEDIEQQLKAKLTSHLVKDIILSLQENEAMVSIISDCLGQYVANQNNDDDYDEDDYIEQAEEIAEKMIKILQDNSHLLID